jgi:hypothetical protein
LEEVGPLQPNARYFKLWKLIFVPITLEVWP